jgi:hypothetical protein
MIATRQTIPVTERLATKLRSATAPEMVQVAPGRWMVNGGGKPPEVVIASLSARGDGTYECLPITERLAALTAALIKRLGFSSDRGRTLKRLAMAGFIEIIYPSPRRALINLDSYYNHLRRVAEDPEFWQDEANRKAGSVGVPPPFF